MDDLIKHIPAPNNRRVTRKRLDEIKGYDRDRRVAVLKNDFALFSAYYFIHTKVHAFADFHHLFFNSFFDLLKGTLMELLLLAFRESAKTSLVKELIIYVICYELEDFIVWDSYDEGNSKRALFDIVVELQTNKRLKEDFGELYNAKRTSDEITQKSVTDFITNPIRDPETGDIKRRGVRVEAHTTQESARGFLFNGKRPGLVILDDFETKKTVRSEAMTNSIRDHIQELKGGIDGIRFRVIYLANYISQFANVQRIIDRQAVDPYLRVHNIPAVENGEPTWKEKYVMTDKEAQDWKDMCAVNGLKLMPKISLETKKRLLWQPDTGDQDWEAEMMNNPLDNTLAIFKRDYFKYLSLEEVIKKKVACFVIIDPALSEKDKSDDTGVSIIWTDEMNEWYSKVFKVRINSLELVNFLFDVTDYLTALGTPPRKIGIEKEKYYGAVYPFLKVQMQQRNRYLPMFAIEIKGRKKEDRITDALRYRYENGVITHVMGEMTIGKDDPQKGSKCIKVPALMSDYETQAQRFPAGGHDDMLDSHAYGSDIVRFDAPESQEEKRRLSDPYSIDAFVERIEKKNREGAERERALAEEREYLGAYGDTLQQDAVDDYFDEIGG